jgi:hypothetical protein
MKTEFVICGTDKGENGMKKIISRFIKSSISSGSRVSQICIGNGNIQCRGDVVNGKIVINGKEINPDDETWIQDEIVRGDVKIEIIGDVREIDIPVGDITIKGSVTGGVKTSQGDIEIGGDVEGDVTTSMGDITIKGNHLNGNVRTSMGDVNING